MSSWDGFAAGDRDKPLYPQAPQAMYSPPGIPPGIPQSFPGKDFPVPRGQLGMASLAVPMEPMGQPPPPFKEQLVPEAQVYDEPEMQAKPGLFTNERGNLKFVAAVSRCPCCSLLIVYAICIGMTIALAASLSKAVRDSGEGIGAIVSQASQYQINDVRSIKQDSFMMAMDEMKRDLKAKDLPSKEPIVERPQTQMTGIFYLLYEAKKGADFNVFNADFAKEVKTIETIATGRDDFKDFCKRFDTAQYPACDTVTLSALRFMYASQFNADEAKYVVAQLEKEDVKKAHKIMGPCVDNFHLETPQALWPTATLSNVTRKFGGRSCDAKNLLTDAEEQFSFELSQRIVRIMLKLNGKGEAPVEDMATLARFVAFMKELPSQAMFVDFHVDKNFNTSNTKCQFTRSILPFGGPLDRTDSDGVRLYLNTSHEKDKQTRATKQYIIDKLEKDFAKTASGSYSDKIQVYYFMTALIFDIFIQILLMDGALAVFSIALVFIYIWVVVGSLFLAVVGMSEILLSIPCAWFFLRVICQVKYFAGINMMCIFIVCAVGADDIFVFMDAYVQSQFKGPNVNRDMETRFSWVYRKSGLAMLVTSATTCFAFLACLGTPIPDPMAFGIFAALVIAADYILVITMYCTGVMVFHNRLEKNGMCSCKVPTPMGACTCACCIENCDCSLSDPSPTQKALAASTTGQEVERDKIEKFFREKFAPLILNPYARIVILVVAVAWLIPAVIWVFKLQPTTKPEQFLNKNHPFQRAIDVLNNNFGANSRDPGIDIYYIWGLKDVDRKGVNILLNSSYVGKPQYDEKFKFDTACQDKIYQICQDLKFRNSTSEYLDMIQRNKKGEGSIKCFVNDLKDSYLKDLTKAGANRDTPSRWMPAFMKEMVPEIDDEDTTKMISREQFYNGGSGMHMGWNGEALKFVAISIEAKSITQWDQPAENVMLAKYNQYDNLRQNLNDIAQEACGSEVFMTDLNEKFVFMNTQRVYRTSSLTGALIGVAIALAVLILCTQDIMLSLLATLSILATLVSVIGFCTMVGWELGSVEAILITILAGFAVDYVVHLAHAYAHNYGSREERLINTFSEMGSPVFSGMATSILASLPLFACNLQFFAKFGTFLCLTILFSWLFSNFCFMGILATIGPAKYRRAPESIT